MTVTSFTTMTAFLSNLTSYVQARLFAQGMRSVHPHKCQNDGLGLWGLRP